MNLYFKEVKRLDDNGHPVLYSSVYKIEDAENYIQALKIMIDFIKSNKILLHGAVLVSINNQKGMENVKRNTT